MEQFKLITVKGIDFNVGNKGTIQVVGSKKGKFIKTLTEFSESGGREDSKYSVTHGQLVHRLVATAWIGEIEKGLTVNHIDGNKKNNEVTNLEIISHKENIQHAWENGMCEGVRNSLKKAHSKPITLFKDNELIGEFDSIEETAWFLHEIIGGKSGTIYDGIRNIAAGKWTPTRGNLKGYTAKFKEDNISTKI